MVDYMVINVESKIFICPIRVRSIISTRHAYLCHFVTFFTFFLNSVFKLYIIQKYFVPLQKIMAVTGIFPSGSVCAMHKPSGSAVPNRDMIPPIVRAIIVM